MGVGVCATVGVEVGADVGVGSRVDTGVGEGLRVRVAALTASVGTSVLVSVTGWVRVGRGVTVDDLKALTATQIE